MAITIQSIKVKDVKYKQLVQMEIHHTVNEYARARLVLIVNEAQAKAFMEHGGVEDKIEISIKEAKKTTVLFRGYAVNVNFQLQVGYNLMTIDLRDASYLLDIKRLNGSFQKLDAKYKNILEGQVADAGGTIQFKVDDKAIEKDDCPAQRNAVGIYQARGVATQRKRLHGHYRRKPDDHNRLAQLTGYPRHKERRFFQRIRRRAI